MLKLSIVSLVVVLSLVCPSGARPAKFDYNGDGRSELVVVANGTWSAITHDSSYFVTKKIGDNSSIPLTGNYLYSDGVKSDFAIYNNVNANWQIQRTSDLIWTRNSTFGFSGVYPIPADYDGDGITDLAVYYDKKWYLQRTKSKFIIIDFGDENSLPAVGDFNGDGTDDIAVVANNKDTMKMKWKVYLSATNIVEFEFGELDSVPIPGYYINRSNVTPAVWSVDKSTGDGYFVLSKVFGADESPFKIKFGKATDIPIAGCDFDGDGKTDMATYDNNGVWSIWLSRSGGKKINFGHKGARAAGEYRYSIHMPIIEPKDFKGTLWKATNHNKDGVAILFAKKYRAEYDAQLWSGLVVSTDPTGKNVLPGGVGRIVPPYADGRPIIRVDKDGSYFGTNAVYMVLLYKDGRKQPWLIPNPSLRTE